MKHDIQKQSPLWISAGLVVTEGVDPELAYRELLQVVAQTQQEPGCLRFELLRHQHNPTSFTLWEGWVDEAALQAHYAAPYTHAYLQKGYTGVRYLERLLSPVIGVEGDV